MLEISQNGPQEQTITVPSSAFFPNAPNFLSQNLGDSLLEDVRLNSLYSDDFSPSSLELNSMSNGDNSSHDDLNANLGHAQEELQQWQAEERRKFDSMEAQKHAFHLEEVPRTKREEPNHFLQAIQHEWQGLGVSSADGFFALSPEDQKARLEQYLEGPHLQDVMRCFVQFHSVESTLRAEQRCRLVGAPFPRQPALLFSAPSLSQGPVLPPQHRPCSTQCSHCACTVAKDNWAGYVDNLSPYVQSVLKNPLQFNSTDQAYVRLTVPLISKHEGVQNMMSEELNRRATCGRRKCQWGSSGKMNKFLKRSGLRTLVRRLYPDAGKISRKAKRQRPRPY